MGFLGDTVIKNPPDNAGDAGLILGREDPWRRKWQPTPVFLPEDFHGQREEPGMLQSMVSQRVGCN